MRVIGVSGDCAHNSAVALIRDGALVYAEAEERMSRKKDDGGCPERTLAEALARSGPGGHVLVGAGQPEDPALEMFARALTDVARRLGFDLKWVEHHRAHARCAAYTAGLDDGGVVTADGQGNGTTTAFWRVRDGALYRRWHTTLEDGSLGFFFAAVTEYLGFKRLRDEGKVCALAASGAANSKLIDILARVLWVEEDRHGRPRLRVDRAAVGEWRVDQPLMGRQLADALDVFAPADVACAAQLAIEEALLSLVAPLCREYGINRLAIAGGLFANVRLNRRLVELPCIREVFVAPPMGDDGLALGASAEIARQLGDGGGPCPSMYLGTTAVADPDTAHPSFVRHEASAEEIVMLVANLLVDGEIVARCAGPGEFGPRALGNRSLLYRPDDPSAKNWLNLRLGRDPVMPFAPCVREEDLAVVTPVDPTLYGGLREMTVAVPVTDEFHRLCPGAVHLDGSARVQAVGREEAQQLWEVLSRFRQLTGLPALINTSLNRHGEPICRTLADALTCAAEARLDWVLAGPATLFHRATRSLPARK
jgi:carbamoyltransferase